MKEIRFSFRSVALVLLLLALTLLLGLGYALPARADSNITVTVCVKDHNGNGLAGAHVYYKLGSICNFGTTDSTGCVTKDFPAGTRNLEVWAVFNNTVSAHVTQDISLNPNFNFQTVLLTLRLETCGGTPLDGGHPRYGIGSTYTTWWFPGGVTGTSAPGETSAEFFPGTYSFEMQYKATADAKLNVVIPNANTKITWQTTKVTLYYSGQISYGSYGDSTWFEKPSMELLGGTYWFHFRGGDYYTQLTISGPYMTKVVNILTLKDHNGNPLSGGKTRGGFGSNYSTWWVPGTTDANGVLFDIRDVKSQPTNMSYEMRYNNTTKVITQDVSANSVFQYQTNLLTLRLETCGGTTLDGGHPRYGIGSTYTTWWFPGGVTGTSAPGETSAEFFPGTYSFEMQYKATADAKLNVVIPNANTKITWQTTKVTLQYSGQISYGGPYGDSTWFTKPSMELLPGTYKFDFRGAGRMDLTFSGCEFTRSVFALKLISSSGSGISGGIGQYYDSGWYTIPGSTGSDGILLHAVPGLKGTLNFRVSYAGASQEKWQNIASNSIVQFQTTLVTFKLLDSNGSDLNGGAQYYASGWNTFGSGTTPATMELLPVSYNFRVSYAGASQEKWQNVGADPNVIFQTVKVHSDSGSCIQYYASGWKTFVQDMELLPVSYSFRFSDGFPETWYSIVAGTVNHIH
ncbi:MAG: hypothetical protein NUV70_05255 [Caldiserica bacterium]|jgi:hypothetical protein|nr:hypothetical protein [Caldisericota bacterium]